MIPVMSADEVACYRQYLTGASAVLEYGVGGSTVLAAECKNIASLYSLDSDAAWLAKVACQVPVAKMIEAGRAKLIHADIGPVRKWGKPSDYSYVLRWPGYAKRPWQDGFKPDLVLIDGRFRVSCILQALKKGGPDLKIAIHDFWKRRNYHCVLRFTSVLDRAGTLAILKSNGSQSWQAGVLALSRVLDRR